MVIERFSWVSRIVFHGLMECRLLTRQRAILLLSEVRAFASRNDGGFDGPQIVSRIASQPLADLDTVTDNTSTSDNQASCRLLFLFSLGDSTGHLVEGVACLQAPRYAIGPDDPMPRLAPGTAEVRLMSHKTADVFLHAYLDWPKVFIAL
jgi:hypothetical protein